MIEIILLVTSFFSLASVVFLLYSKAGNQILIPAVWWFVWSIVGVYYPLGYFNVISSVSILICAVPSFICFGYVFSKIYLDKRLKNMFIVHERKTKKINAFSIIFTIPFCVWLIWNFINFILSDSPQVIRQLVYSTDTPYYGGKFFEYISSQFVKPFGIALLWFGVFVAVINNSYRLFAHGSIFMLIVSIVEMGRFGVYMTLLGLILIYINSNFSSSKKVMKLIFIILCSLIFLLTYYRSSDLDDFTNNIIHTYILRYHTLFVGLLNYEFLEGSLLHERTYGFSSVFTFVNPLIVIFKALNIWQLVPIDGLVGADLDSVRIIGYWDNEPIGANAYVSIIYGLFKDFYFFGPPIFFFLVGAFLSRRINSNPFAIPIIYLVFFGIFQQSFNFTFYSSLFFYWVMVKFSSIKFKQSM